MFVRLTGCPLRCQYCDTAYAFHGGEWRSVDERPRPRGASSRRATCASPAASRWRRRTACRCSPQLCDAGYRVSLETSGAMPLAGVDARVIRVVDVKTPGSGEERRNRYDDLALLRPEEQIKFVICDRADYEWSREKIAALQLADALPGAVLAQRRTIAGARTRGLDPRRPAAGALPDAAAQGALGQRARESER